MSSIGSVPIGQSQRDLRSSDAFCRLHVPYTSINIGLSAKHLVLSLCKSIEKDVVGEQGSQVELHDMQTPRYDSRHGDGQVEADDQCNIVDEDIIVDEECKEQ